MPTTPIPEFFVVPSWAARNHRANKVIAFAISRRTVFVGPRTLFTRFHNILCDFCSHLYQRNGSLASYFNKPIAAFRAESRVLCDDPPQHRNSEGFGASITTAPLGSVHSLA